MKKNILFFILIILLYNLNAYANEDLKNQSGRLVDFNFRGFINQSTLGKIIYPFDKNKFTILEMNNLNPVKADGVQELSNDCAANFKMREDLNNDRRIKHIFKDPEVATTSKSTSREAKYIDLNKEGSYSFVQSVKLENDVVKIKTEKFKLFREYQGPVIELIETSKHEPASTGLGTAVLGTLTGGLMFFSEDIRRITLGCTIVKKIEKIDLSKSAPTERLAIEKINASQHIVIEVLGKSIDAETDDSGSFSFKLTGNLLLESPKSAKIYLRVICTSCDQPDRDWILLDDVKANELAVTLTVDNIRLEAERNAVMKLFHPPLNDENYKKINSLGFYDLETLKAKLARMSVEYSNEKDINSFLFYLEDESKSKSNGKKITYYKELREAENKRIAIQNEKERALVLGAIERMKKANLERLEKEYPFYAVLNCGNNNDTSIFYFNVFLCFTGDNVKTQLEYQTGSVYKMYTAHDILGLSANKDGRYFTIDLRKSFFIKAQNANDSLLLNLKIYNRATKQIVFEKSAAKFGVIYINNQ